MLATSQHRLWIARNEKPRIQQATAKLIQRTGEAGWMIQASSAVNGPQFLDHTVPMSPIP
jgi:hypothetical protein